jgi:DNA (cytosine-5)-methyltransferase 1
MKKRKKNFKPTIVDVFSGVGGLSLGASRAGFELASAVELDARAMATHQANFPQAHHVEQDVATLRGRDLLSAAGLQQGELVGLIGGPPCQGFSVIGQRDRLDPRNDMFAQFMRLVAEIRPAFFMVENVPGIQNKQYRRLLKSALNLVPKRYCMLDPFTVSANEFGAPTVRKRVIFFGYDPHRVEDLKVVDFEAAKPADVDCMNVRAALHGMPLDVSENSIDEDKSWRCVRVEREGWFYDRISGHIPDGVGSAIAIDRYTKNWEVQGNFGTRHSPEIARRYDALDHGEVDPITKSMRLDPVGLCPTLRAGTGPERGSFQAVRPIHYLRPRVITPREAARLQGFPDWFVLDRTKWHSFRQLGNSVSPVVAESLLSVVAPAVRN